MRLVLGLALSCCATAALAATEASWAALDAAESKGCMAEITNRYGRDPYAAFGVTGHISGIGGANSDANYAVLIQRTSKRGTDTWICLYDKQTKTVSAGLVQMRPQ
jgi:hypothetical protein